MRGLQLKDATLPTLPHPRSSDLPPPSQQTTKFGSSTRWISIGEIAREYQVTLRALRFYEARGLLDPVRQGHHRLYGPRDRGRLRLILAAKQLGFTLVEISGMLDNTRPEADLKLDTDVVMRQITYLETQHRAIETALTTLRQRYYAISETEIESEAMVHV